MAGIWMEFACDNQPNCPVYGRIPPNDQGFGQGLCVVAAGNEPNQWCVSSEPRTLCLNSMFLASTERLTVNLKAIIQHLCCLAR